MWVLRKPGEITQVTCISLTEPFTIGRIECSFNITDDKSVSRRHASITFPPSVTHPLLTDLESKFGTFVNGDRVNPSVPKQLNHGDTMKLGGAMSEFVLECRDFGVYLKSKSEKTVEMFGELEHKFGIEIVGNVQDATYVVLDEIEEIDSDLVTAFLSSKFIVSSGYFAQLVAGNVFSLGLIQPAIISKLFPPYCWLPRKERLNVFRAAFEGIRRFTLLSSGDKYEQIIKTIGEALRIETKSLIPSELKDMKFNELLVVTLSLPDPTKLVEPIRTVKYQSILEALIRCDGKLIEIETVYPVASKAIVIDNFVEVEDSVPKRTAVVKESAKILPTEPPRTTEPLNTEMISDYKGPSLTAVIPMPTSLLRPTMSPSQIMQSSGMKTKFVKCHPRYRQPGTIPALIGPDQLKPCRPIAVNNTTTETVGMKRRILVRDSWLAEDDLAEELVKENRKIDDSSPVNTGKITSTSAYQSSNIKPLDSVNIPSNTVDIPHHTISSTSNLPTAPTTTPNQTSTTTSKFQSSFFKNLSKGK